MAPPRAFAQPTSREGDAELLQELLKRHATPSNAEPLRCLLATAIGFLLTFALLARWPGWMSALLFGCATVRCFIVFHDACHNSFFRDRQWNAWLAQALAPIACMTAEDWRENHNHHHAHLGDSSVFDASLTIYHETTWFASRSTPFRLLLRVWRDPLVFFWTFSIYLFMLDALWQLLRRPCLPRVFRLGLYGLIGWACGTTVLKWYLVGQVMSGAMGVMLFHLQHQCNTPYRVDEKEHSVTDAGLLGSTYLMLPWPLTWFTLGIEYHHVHHASTRVPSYRLAACHADGEEKGLWRRCGVNYVGPVRALKSLCHVMYAPGKKSFVSFPLYQQLGLQD